MTEMTSFNPHMEQNVHDFLMRVYEDPDQLADAMKELSLAHAERLLEQPVHVLEIESCPRCGGTIIAGETTARCAAGCDWRST